MRNRRFFVVFVGLFFAGPTAIPAADVHFSEYHGYLETSTSAVVIGDIDGDHFLDFVFTDEAYGQVRIRSGEPLNEFIGYVGDLDSPTTLALGDLDGDGDNDVVVGQFNNIPIVGDPPYPAESAEILWLQNPLNGGGGWTAHGVSLLTSEGMRDVALADMDADGDLDIVEARSGGFSWAANDGTPADGGWVIHTINSSPIQPWGVAVVDIDGDGDLDVVGSDVTGDELQWFESEDGGGDGVPDDFWAAHNIDAGLDGAAGIDIGDFNSDGLPDVVAAAAVGDRVSWYANPGWTKIEVPYAFDGASSVQAVDLDLDGDLDILATAENADDVAWFENSDGVGGTWIIRTIDASSDGAVDAAAGDFDGDGDPDLVVASLFDLKGINLWINRTNHRRFFADDSIDIRVGLADPRTIEVADVNGDGLEDVVTALWGNGEIKLYLGFNAYGTAWWEIDVATGFTSARDVAVADVDGDGDLDILGAAVGADKVSWWENDGDALPEWTGHSILITYDGAHRVEPADFDRDGDIDVAVAAFDGDNVSWVENKNGAGTSWTRHDLGAFDGAFDLAVGDLNRDGKPDLVATAYNEDLVEYFLNSPTGGLWSAGQVDDLLDGPRGVDLGDIDLDGDVDVVVVVRNDEDIFWYENDGTGTGWTQHNVGTGDFPDGVAVRVADLDGDGDLDVAAVNQDGNDVFIWKNDDRGDSWTKFTMEQNLDSTWDLDVADIDRDGKLDIAVAAGGTADSLVWYPNLGDQFSQVVQERAPRVMANWMWFPVFNITVRNNGRDGLDSAIEITELKMEFYRADGETPLTTSEIDSMLFTVRLWADTDNNAIFDYVGDTAAAGTSDLTLVDGVLTWDLTSWGETINRLVWPDNAEIFFLDIEVEDPESPTPEKFIVRIPAGGLRARDVTYDVPVASEVSEAETTGVISIGYELFSDDFEGGTMSAWSSSSGG